VGEQVVDALAPAAKVRGRLRNGQVRRAMRAGGGEITLDDLSCPPSNLLDVFIVDSKPATD
jgi:hypothetical protein